MVLFVLCSVLFAKAQQDPQFSNNMYNQVTQNPAFVGVNNKWNVGGVLREQWSGIDGAPSTSVFNFDLPFKIINTYHGVGITFLSDKLGDVIKQSITSVSLSYAYKHKFGGGILSIGARATYVNYSLEGKGFLPVGAAWDNQRNLLQEITDGKTSFDESEGLFDLGTGLLYTHKKWYLGMAVNHLLEPSLFSKQVSDENPDYKGKIVEMHYNRHFYFTGGYTYEIKPSLVLVPSLHVVSDLSSYLLTGTVNCIIKKDFWLGTSYRQDDAIIIHAGVQFKGGLRLGYSFDYGVSEISRTSNGSHELFMNYSFEVKAKKQIMSSVRFL